MKQKSAIHLFIYACLFLCFTGNVFASTLQASVNRIQVARGESLVLELVVKEGELSGAPDLSPLKKGFTVLGVSQFSRQSTVNGKSTSTFSLKITLLPKTQGALVIPALHWGGKTTSPLKISVTKASSTITPKTRFFIKTSVSKAAPYEQSQVIYTVKIYLRDGLSNLQLVPPQAAGINILPLDGGSNYQVMLQGVGYKVIEKKFAMFPQKPGEILIVPPTLIGLDYSRANPREDFLFSSMAGEQVRIVGQPISLHVKKSPQNIAWWLPSPKVSVTARWDTIPPVFRVGEPVSRKLELQAQGVLANQLPKFSVEAVSGLTFYPGKAKLHNALGAKGVVASRTETVVVIPKKTGDFILPAISVSWWNTGTEKSGVVVIPAKSIHVLPALHGASTSPSSSMQIKSNDGVSKQNNSVLSGKSFWYKNGWFWGMCFVLFMWIVTCILWGFCSRKKKQKECAQKNQKERRVLTLSAIKKKLKKACKENCPLDAKFALLQYAECRWPDKSFNSLINMAEFLGAGELSDAIYLLDARCYKKEERWEMDVMWEAFLAWEKANKNVKKHKGRGGLPPLYPE
jgi:hypothetical protein